MTGEAWRQYLQTYVALRRAIGFTMQREARLLQDFVDHLERRLRLPTHVPGKEHVCQPATF